MCRASLAGAAGVRAAAPARVSAPFIGSPGGALLRQKAAGSGERWAGLLSAEAPQSQSQGGTTDTANQTIYDATRPLESETSFTY